MASTKNGRLHEGLTVEAYDEQQTFKRFASMAKRRNLKKEKQERNRAYARKFKKRKLRNDGRGEGAGNGVTGTASNGGAAD
jgi:hypothetical protein